MGFNALFKTEKLVDTVPPRLSVYIIVTFPALNPFTSPFISMVATEGLLEDQGLTGLDGGVPQETHVKTVELPIQTELSP